MTTFSHTFSQVAECEPFTAYRAACRYLRERGFSIGHMQARSPSGILYGAYVIQKWRNLSAADRAALDGEMTGDFRSGPVEVRVHGAWAHKAMGAPLRESADTRAATARQASATSEMGVG